MGPDQYCSYQQFEDKVLKDQLMELYMLPLEELSLEAENRVYIDPTAKDEFGVPLQQVQYSLSNKDRQAAKQVEQGIIRSAKAMGVTLDNLL